MADGEMGKEPALTPKNYLFVCSQNRWRSPTAEHIFADVPGIQVLSAGVHHQAVEPLSNDLIEWADTIFVMESAHRAKVQARFRSVLGNTKVVVLGIPDRYRFMDPQLVKILKTRMGRWLR